MSEGPNSPWILSIEEMEQLKLGDEEVCVVVALADGDCSSDATCGSPVVIETDKDAEHDELRKKRNRDAAKRVREKTTQKQNDVKQDVLRLQSDQANLKYQLVEVYNELEGLIKLAEQHKNYCPDFSYNIDMPVLPSSIEKMQGIPDFKKLAAIKPENVPFIPSARRQLASNEGMRNMKRSMRSEDCMDSGTVCSSPADDRVKKKLKKIIEKGLAHNGMPRNNNTCTAVQNVLINPQTTFSDTTTGPMTTRYGPNQPNIGTIYNGMGNTNIYHRDVSGRRSSTATSTVTSQTVQPTAIHIPPRPPSQTAPKPQAKPEENRLLSLVRRIRSQSERLSVVSSIPSIVEDAASETETSDNASIQSDFCNAVSPRPVLPLNVSSPIDATQYAVPARKPVGYTKTAHITTVSTIANGFMPTSTPVASIPNFDALCSNVGGQDMKKPIDKFESNEILLLESFEDQPQTPCSILQTSVSQQPGCTYVIEPFQYDENGHLIASFGQPDVGSSFVQEHDDTTFGELIATGMQAVNGHDLRF